MSRELTYLASFLLVAGMAARVSAQLPPGWSNQDIGGPAAVGSAQYDQTTRTWTIQADGTGIRGTADQFHFVYKPLTGSGELVLRVVSLEPAVDEWAMAGVMIRLFLTEDSPYAFMGITPNGPAQDHGATYWGRGLPGTAADHESSGAMTFPYWVKIVRDGAIFAGYHSPDGETWTEQWSSEEPLVPPDTYIGLAVTSNVGGTLVKAVFDEGPVKAHSPNPADGTQHVAVPYLRWKPGVAAAFHDVYFGTNPNPGPDEYITRLPLLQTLYFHTPGIEPGATYYWRIDEVDADETTIRTGDVWSFTAAPYTAYAPQPWDGARWVDFETDLQWTPGVEATTHDVYFGTDKAAVQAADPSVSIGNQAAPTYDPGTLAENTTYYWRIDEHGDGDVVHEGQVWKFTTFGPGAGVKARYFEGMELSGAPVLSQVEDSIDHNWGSGEVVAGINDQISARWTANLEAPFTETYQIIANSDDGVRLWLDGRLLIDNWANGNTEDTAVADLVAGQAYYLEMEWYEDGGGAVAALSWQSPSIPKQSIPTGWLQLSTRATDPYPANTAVDTTQNPLLRWRASESAAVHNVYFGDDAEAVADATPADAGIYRGQQALETTTFNPGPLEWNKTYYWRVDEVNALDADSPWKGVVWRFTTADFVVVDDFESYTNDVGRRVFEKWVDGLGFTLPEPGHPGNGTGAAVGHDIWSAESPYLNRLLMETGKVHGGGQAMPLYYDNTKTPYRSEAERTWTTGQNWTLNGVDTLILYTRGEVANDGVPLYVAVEDTAGRTAVVACPESAAATATDWVEWKIPLSDLTDAGVAVTAVKKMSIGAGSRTAPTPGGTGVIYVDDIRVDKP